MKKQVHTPKATTITTTKSIHSSYTKPSNSPLKSNQQPQIPKIHHSNPNKSKIPIPKTPKPPIFTVEFDSIPMYHHDTDFPIDVAAAVAAESTWTRYEDKLFEDALVMYPDDVIGRWQKIAAAVPGKSPEEVRAHYEVLVHDLLQIDSGHVELPSYSDDGDESVLSWDPELRASQISFGVNRGSKHGHGDGERKKGTPWTEEEHRLFLIGLQRYGKGDWRSISRNVVVSRTPTQVASHAQKYFLRQNSMKKERKRSSIHDITTATDTVAVSVAVPVTSPPTQQNYQGGGGGGSTTHIGYEQNFGYTM